MSNNDKQVQEALQAIRKLVETSEDQMTASDDIVTLDNVVWRNPVKDEIEAPDASLDEGHARKTPVARLDAEPIARRWGDDSAVSMGKAPQASASISARDLDEIAKAKDSMREVVATPVTSPLDLRTAVAHHAESEMTIRAEQPIMVAADEPVLPQKAELKVPEPEEDDVITELTSPLGRKGGGFYDEAPMPSPTLKKPLLPTLAAADKAVSTPAINQAEEVKYSSSSPNDEPASAPMAAPAITDFHGLDFNFSAAEGLMSAASFAELDKTPITPEVAIPTAEPAVSDPVSEVQAMYPAQEEEADERGDDAAFEATGHPNLHIVSDKSAIDEEEEEGFSGAVRLALRSIIKEQVSTWLQGNMTGLIEEALSTPQKRPSSASKPTSKKR